VNRRVHEVSNKEELNISLDTQ